MGSRAPSSSSRSRSRRQRSSSSGSSSRSARRSRSGRRSSGARGRGGHSSPSSSKVAASVGAAQSDLRAPVDVIRVGGASSSGPGVSDCIHGSGDSNVALVRRAAALRAKYKRHQYLMRIPVMQIGAHPDNRDGQGPSGSRCLELTGKILSVGFDDVEADANGVLVEEKPGSNHICSANRRFADGDELLAPIVDGQITYGTLSHSTLNQLMRNIWTKCPVAAGAAASGVSMSEGSSSAVAEDDALARIVDKGGRLSLTRLQEVDSAFAKAVQSGLQWEVLSYAIEVEEPDGCAVIQSALNAKNGLFLVAHEMQALSRLMTLTASSAVAEVRLTWEQVLARVRETMPQFASDKNFIDLYAFVVDLGGQNSVFLQDLRAFHQRFVNPQLRRLQLESFLAANALPIEMPHLKIALVKHIYVDGKASHGFLRAPPLKFIKSLSSDGAGCTASAVAEDVLRFFHVDCDEVLNNLEGGLKIKFLANLDKDMFGKLLSSDTSVALDDGVRACGASYHARLLKIARGVPIPKWDFGNVKTGSLAPAEEILQPKVLVYDARGFPVTRQEEQEDSTRFSPQVFNWSAFMQTSTVVECFQETCQKAFILSHLHSLHSQLPPVTEADLRLVKNDIQGGGVRVVALKAMREGALRMAPIVTGSSSHGRLTKTPNATYVLRIRLAHSGENAEWFLNGSGTLPPPSSVSESGGSVAQQHAWQPGHFPWPLWFVKRVSAEVDANCKFQDMDVRSVSTFALKEQATSAVAEEAFADNTDITIPVLVNTAVLAVGEELKVHWPSQSRTAKDTRSSMTWATQARRQLSKAKQK